MNELTPKRMSVEEYLDWAVDRPGRYELVRGRPIRMSPETTGHIKVKVFVVLALLEATKRAAADLHALGDGATVRIDDDTAFEPDALIYAGPELPASDMIVPAPVIVIEVVSPSSGGRDSGIKLAGYFRVPSVAHYLIVDPEHETVIHHRRDDERGIATCILGRDDTIDLTPPGIRLPVARCFARD